MSRVGNLSGVSACIGKDPLGKQQLQAALDLCVSKTRRAIKRLADEPKSAAWAVDGNYFDFKEGFFEIGNWTSSFFTGMALLAWRHTEDDYFLKQALRLAAHYREKVFTHFRDTHHDLGFLYSLYSVALYKLTDEREHRHVGLRAADLLAARFNPRGNFIRAWGRMDEVESAIGDGTMRTDNMAIIDCLMNLPLLFWASNETGDEWYREVAVRHADMCLKHFIRADHSTNNLYLFDPSDWRPLGDPNQGYWARGASWAIYGFALNYGYTQRKEYLDASVRLAMKFISHLDDEIVPWNDFYEAPHPARLRDSSAAAIVVCGFQELARHGADNASIANARQSLMAKLCSDDWLNRDEACFGVQRGGQGGGNGYTSWGDYFLMEALCRELSQEETFW
jgi:unsaturated chondroitin disaccharide hydrolase